MRIIQYLKSSKVAVVLITLLLIVQAFADLSLPRYTSDLVDVGIQQGGIEHASPDEMSAATFNYVCMLADENDEQLIRDSYAQADSLEGVNSDQANKSVEGRVVLTKQGKQQRETLDVAIALPLVLVHAQDILGDFGQEGQTDSTQADQDTSTQAAQNTAVQKSQDNSAQATQDTSELSAQMGQLSSFDLAQVYAAYQSGALSKSEILSLIDQARAMFGNIDDSLIEQQAIEAVKAEYKALGMDLGSIQLQYLAWLGALILAVAA